MNVVQILRKARLGCDAILPGGTASALWATDELIDLATQANDDLNLRLRLVRKKYGLQSSTLSVVSGDTTVSLPADFAEVSRILCTNKTSVRFKPAEFESQYWIEAEQRAREEDGTFLSAGTGIGDTYFYDIIGERTLALTPPVVESLTLALSYVPAKRPLYYSNTGTVTLVNGSTAVIGTSTVWQSDGVYAGESDQACELIVGTSNLSATTIRLDRDYPAVSAVTDNRQLVLASAWGSASVENQAFILAMVPTLPKIYHRWIAELMSAFMLRKVNPDLADKYATALMGRFDAVIRPTASVRQSQESVVTDDDESFGGLSD